MRTRIFVVIGIAAVSALARPRPCAAAVNLELRPPSQSVVVGNSVSLGLYAVSTTGGPTPVGRVRAIVSWNSDYLLLTSVLNNGPYAWLFSGLPNDSTGDGINNTFEDGNAFYEALAQFNPLASATPSGLLVATLQFTSLDTVASTSVSIIPQVGGTTSEVLNGLPPGGVNVTGTLGSATAMIICSSAAQCNDQNPCTTDACSSQNCSHVPNDAIDPDDGLFCNGVEGSCQGGMIVYDVPPPDCDDTFSCTNDSCDEAMDTCVNAIQSNRCLIEGACYTLGTFNPINDCEVCNSSVSQTSWSFRPMGAACGDSNNSDCDNPDTCNGSGTCLSNTSPDGAACTTDGNDCTTDVCSGGVCVHPPSTVGTSCGSSADTTCTDPDQCDGAGNCSAHNVPDSTPCDDGLFCSTGSACLAGECTGTGSPCPSTQVCDEVNDACKAVNLVWSPPQQIVILDATVDIELYAVSGIGVDMPFAAVGVILSWDPSHLELLGHFDDGPYLWTSSSFPADCGLDALNAPCKKSQLPQNDGNAYYEAIGDFGPTPPAVATPSGIKITTFRFRALSTGITPLNFVSEFGQFTTTRVLDADVPALNILGTLGDAANADVLQCTIDAHCDDDQFCTGAESCVDTLCVEGSYPCGALLCNEDTNACVVCVGDAECGDGLFCNGAEVCVGGNCSPGTYPCGQLLCNEEFNACVNCLEDFDCDDGVDCSMDFCQSGLCNASPDDSRCGDGVFCNGIEFCDVEMGCQSPGNPCPDPVTCEEPSGTCGGCESPTVVSEGCRFLQVLPPPGPDPVGLFVYGDRGDGDVACVALYVQADGTLAPQPFFQTPAQWGTVHLHGLEVRPTTSYTVHTDCGTEKDSLLSAGSSDETWHFGDLDGSGGADLNDLLLMIDAFSGNMGSLTVYNADLMPCEPDGVIDLTDLIVMISAFSGAEVSCGRPCPTMGSMGLGVAFVFVTLGGAWSFRGLSRKKGLRSLIQ